MQLDSKLPIGPDRKGLGQAQVRNEAGESGQQAQVHDHRGRLGPGRRRGRGHAGRARLQRQVLLLPGSARAAPTASPRRAASTPPRIIRTTATASIRLFYDTVKGGDFRVARSQRLPPGADQRQHHRPVRGAGRPLRARIRRHAGQPLLRRRAGLAHVLRARPDRPAASARRLSGARAADRRRQSHDVPAHRDARPGRHRRQGARHRHARPGHRQDRVRTWPTPSCSAPAATATSSISPPMPRGPTAPPSGAPTSAAPRSPIRASRRFIPPAFRSPATINRSSR